MKVLNLGSMNLDYVYNVDHIIMPGETMSTGAMNIFLGGKGINQSIAIAKAGVEVYHAGLIGHDGGAFLEACDEYGIKKDYIKTIDEKTGHTIIQVDKNAENCILLYGGANRKFTKEYIDSVLSNFNSGDILVLQNEVNLLSYIIDKAYEIGMIIVLNPSPFNKIITECDLSKVSIFLLNEVEGGQITGKSDNEEIISELSNMFLDSKIVLTLGKEGVIYCDKDNKIYQKSFKVKAVDTTAAGDTFTGYFIAGLVNNADMKETLMISSKAASIAVTKMGAVQSIPFKAEVINSID